MKNRKLKSSGDSSAVHPYVIAAKALCKQIGDKEPWSTSKITRRLNKITGEINVSVQIYQK